MRKHPHIGNPEKTIRVDHRYCKGQKRKSGAGKGFAVFLAFLLSLSPAGCSPSPTPETSASVTTMAEKTTSAAEEKTTAAEQGSSSVETSITTTERTTEESSSYAHKESSTEEETTAETEESTEEPTEISTEANETETTQESTEAETTPSATTERPTEASTPEPTEPPTQAPTQAPTKPEPTTSEPTTEAPTKPQVVLTGIEASVANKTRYIGDTLTAGDFTVKGIYSDGSKKDINGWDAVPLELNAASNSVTVTYLGMTTVVTVAATVKPTDPPKEAKVVDLEIVENGIERIPGWKVFNYDYGEGFDVNAIFSDGTKRKVEAAQYAINMKTGTVTKSTDGYEYVDHTDQNRYSVDTPALVTITYHGITKSALLEATKAIAPTKCNYWAEGDVIYSRTYTASDINEENGIQITVNWEWMDCNGKIVYMDDQESTTGITYKGGPFYVDVGAKTTINIEFEGKTIPVELEAYRGFSRCKAEKDFRRLNEVRKSMGLPELIWWENGYYYTCLRNIQAAEDLYTYGLSAEAGHKRSNVYCGETFSATDPEAVLGVDDIGFLMMSSDHKAILTGNHKGLCSMSVSSNGWLLVSIVYVADDVPLDASFYIDKEYNIRYGDGTLFRNHDGRWDGTQDPRWIDYIDHKITDLLF